MSVLQTGIGPEKGFYPYAIDQSLRFNDDDSAYLERTPATAGNRKTWTWSGWVKRGNLGANQDIFTCNANAEFYFRSNDKIKFYDFASGSTEIETSQVFRDVSAWYHIVLALDTTQSTASNRFKLYVNGQQITDFGDETYPTQNEDLNWNDDISHSLGRRDSANSQFFDGYLAEINFIDGQALDPTSFGEFKSGVWVANEYTGTYGTNGFYLPFTNGLGNDESGNGNDWTPNNLVATDIVLDSPTNNFATLNPLDQTTIGTSGAYSQGNLKFVTSGDSTSNNGTRATMSFDSRKWYWEYLWNSTPSSTYPEAGILRSDTGLDVDTNGNALNSTGGYGVEGDGAKYIDGSASSSGISWSVGDIVQVAVDMDNRYIYIGKNGTWQFSGVPTSGASGTGALSSLGDYYYAPIAGDNNFTSAATIYLNFGQDSSFAGNETAQGNTDENGIGDFYYTPPAGFLALCTANLPEPAISPADDASPSDYFNTVLYTGNESSNSYSGLNFQPDFGWIKNRDNSNAFHILFDVIRGDNVLHSNLTIAEQSSSMNLVFESDGLSFDGSTTWGNKLNDPYVAWNWKANGAGVTNTDGSITSTVSASPESGFSIVSYTGNGSTGTIGHGLESTPDFIIQKSRDANKDWAVYSSELDAGTILRLHDTSPAQSDLTKWDNTEPTSSVFSVGNNGGSNASGEDYIAYCFAPVEGFSKFGSYTGNGSSDGPMIFTGFRPAFIITKRTDSTGSWEMYDSKRIGYNASNYYLYAQASNAEASDIPFDILSNGFKRRSTGGSANASGGTYIYMAFAENPFKYSLAR